MFTMPLQNRLLSDFKSSKSFNLGSSACCASRFIKNLADGLAVIFHEGLVYQAVLFQKLGNFTFYNFLNHIGRLIFDLLGCNAALLLKNRRGDRLSVHRNRLDGRNVHSQFISQLLEGLGRLV